MASLAWPHAGHFNRALTNAAGALYLSTAYNVYLSDGSTLAPIYTDSSKSSPRTQPLTTDAAGNAGFYTDPYSGLVLKIAGNTQVIDVPPDSGDLGNNFFSDGGANSTYTMSGSDNMKQLGFLAGGSTASALTITVPNNLPKNWGCDVYAEGQGTITFVAGSGASLEALNVTSTATVHHPGWKGWVTLLCRYNNSGTQAVVAIANGIT